MKKVRKIIAYKDDFEKFLTSQTVKVQDKIFKILEIIETYEQVPTKYLKSIRGTSGLFEARVKLGSNIWRLFCFFEGDKLVILLNGFQKKTQKTPKREIAKAKKLMQEYYKEKELENKKNGN